MQTESYKTVTLKIPQIKIQETVRHMASIASVRVLSFISSLRSRTVGVSPRFSFTRRLPQLPPQLKNLNLKKILPLIVLLVTAGLTVFGISKLLTRSKSNLSSDGRVIVAGAKATYQLGKEFTFPLIDSKGKTITDIKFVLDTAEMRDEIIVKGKRAVAIQGRTFLILTVKITNDFTKALEINSKDYFRLTSNGNESDLLAPEIHNDPVVVQPTSTKFTRIGWPINDTDKNLVLSVGEIEGEKTKVDLNLQ